MYGCMNLYLTNHKDIVYNCPKFASVVIYAHHTKAAKVHSGCWMIREIGRMTFHHS